MKHWFWSIVEQLGRLLLERAQRELVHLRPPKFETKPRTIIDDMRESWKV